MKKIFTAVFLISFFYFIPLEGDDYFEMLSSGNLEKAIFELEKTIDDKAPDPLKCYNLAVAMEKKGNPGKAVYYYIQALQGSRGFKEARNNLRLLSETENLKIPEKLIDSHTGLILPMILFFLSVYVFAILFIIYIFRPGWKIGLSLIPGGVLMLLFTGLFFIQYREIKKEHTAVSIEENIVYSGPDSALTEIDKLKSGSVLTVMDFSGNWLKVRGFQNNIEGWVDGRKIKSIIKPVY